MSQFKTFLEIGTCDFDTCVEFANSGEWKGVMVEPTPHLVANIRAQAKHDFNLKIEQVACSDYDGYIKFATAKDDNQEQWSRGIGTVVQDNHTGTCLYSLGDNASMYYNEIEQIPCLSLDTIISRHHSFLNHGKIDYLKLDTEGHEWTILKAYSWVVKPTFIKMEHKHINDIIMKELLESQGYVVYVEAEDLYAIHTGD